MKLLLALMLMVAGLFSAPFSGAMQEEEPPRPILHNDHIPPAPLTSADRQEAKVSPCVGDGVSGPRYAVFYVYAEGRTNRYESVVNQLRLYAGGASDIIDASSRETGGRRAIRFVTDAACQIVVTPVSMPLSTMQNFGAEMDWFFNHGYSTPERNVLAFNDDSYFCGIGSLWQDDRDSADNWHNKGEAVAVVGTGCWSANVASHEIGHNLGAVQHTAPHMTLNWHCLDEWDVMCYNDGSGTTSVICPDSAHDDRFDCNHDDYWHTNPPAGSYLDTHWNRDAHPHPHPTTTDPDRNSHAIPNRHGDACSTHAVTHGNAFPNADRATVANACRNPCGAKGSHRRHGPGLCRLLLGAIPLGQWPQYGEWVCQWGGGVDGHAQNPQQRQQRYPYHHGTGYCGGGDIRCRHGAGWPLQTLG
jgi:hypothetical protein